MIDPNYKKKGQDRIDDFEKCMWNARNSANLIDRAVENAYIYDGDALWKSAKTLRKIADMFEEELQNDEQCV